MRAFDVQWMMSCILLRMHLLSSILTRNSLFNSLTSVSSDVIIMRTSQYRPGGLIHLPDSRDTSCTLKCLNEMPLHFCISSLIRRAIVSICWALSKTLLLNLIPEFCVAAAATAAFSTSCRHMLLE